MPSEVSLYIYESDVPEDAQPDTPEFWVKALNDRAQELGLDRGVRAVRPKYAGESFRWVYEDASGNLADLGWNINDADDGLKAMSAGKGA